MRVWIYGSNIGEVQRLRRNTADPQDTIVGASVRASPGDPFPRSGLTPALSAAMRGEIDLLLVSRLGLLGQNLRQAEETAALFQSYGAAVKSAPNIESRSS